MAYGVAPHCDVTSDHVSWSDHPTVCHVSHVLTDCTSATGTHPMYSASMARLSSVTSTVASCDKSAIREHVSTATKPESKR